MIYKKSLLMAFAILTACSGSDGTNGTSGNDGARGLVAVSAEAAGDNCASGGQKIESGVDTNSDMILNTDEVMSTQYVCNGVEGDGTDGLDGLDGTDGTDGIDGPASLVRVSEEPAGLNCDFGGTRVDSGIDADDNGTLIPTEIDHTAYICNMPDPHAVALLSTPNTATVFNDPEVCYFSGNSLTTAMWDRVSNKIISGDFDRDGYFLFDANTDGPANPNTNTSKSFSRTVLVSSTRVIVRGGTSYESASAASHQIGVLNAEGEISALQTATFSDGFSGSCVLASASATEFLCYDGTNIRHYGTQNGSSTLTFLKSLPLGTALPETADESFGSTFAYDGAYYHFASDGTADASQDYITYLASGVLEGTHTAGGNGALGALFFHWGVGRYSAHDGYGNRTGVNNYGTGSDTSCFGAPSPYHF